MTIETNADSYRRYATGALLTADRGLKATAKFICPLRGPRQSGETMPIKDQFIPHLIVSDGLAALEFYKDNFGAEEGHNMMSPDGKKLIHGEIILDGHKLLSPTGLPRAMAVRWNPPSGSEVHACE